MSNAAKVQALPTHSGDSRDVLESLRGIVSPFLFSKLEERVQLGVRKYGTRLQSHNGRDVVLDNMQEALDGVMYSQQGVIEGKIPTRIRDLFIALVVALEALDANQP